MPTEPLFNEPEIPESLPVIEPDYQLALTLAVKLTDQTKAYPGDYAIKIADGFLEWLNTNRPAT